MTTLTVDQEREVTFISGVTSLGTIAAQSFQSWHRDQPATYQATSLEAKWGPGQAGTGAVVAIAFDTASNWTTNETAAFTAALHLWSAEANITFTFVSPSAADAVISRASDRSAEGGLDLLFPGTIGSTRLGSAYQGSVKIDTSVAGFGPLGASFAVDGGYPWHTMVHEIGHLIGLGHAGPYDDGETTSTISYTSYDNTAYSIMSYNDAPGVSGSFTWGYSGGYERAPVTPMILDIAAADRIYGLPTSTPLSGGQTFGFHTNIQGDIAQFFDFTVNMTPIVTLFDKGVGNTLDLSGYGTASNVDLHDGAFSSVAGLQNNLAIAVGTRIDTGIGGGGNDTITGNDDSDVLMGGAGGDVINGGAGNDHIYGNMLTGVQGATDGADTINAGDGSNYVNGNAGNDVITAGNGTNRLYGGGGDDQISVTGHGSSHLNGNLGDDVLRVAGGTNDIHGGQGNDTIIPTGGDNQSFGDLGNDVIWGAGGIDVMTGGGGADLFVLSGPPNAANSWDEIVDFVHGTDKLHVDVTGGGLPLVLHATQGFASGAIAAVYASTVVSATSAAALSVGNDTYLFYSQSGAVEAVKLDGVNAALIDQSDFVAATVHL